MNSDDSVNMRSQGTGLSTVIVTKHTGSADCNRTKTQPSGVVTNREECPGFQTNIVNI